MVVSAPVSRVRLIGCYCRRHSEWVSTKYWLYVKWCELRGESLSQTPVFRASSSTSSGKGGTELEDEKAVLGWQIRAHAEVVLKIRAASFFAERAYLRTSSGRGTAWTRKSTWCLWRRQLHFWCSGSQHLWVSCCSDLVEEQIECLWYLWLYQDERIRA